MTAIPRIAEIQRVVAKHYGLPAYFMREPRPSGPTGFNLWTTARPRQVAMALSYLLTEHSQARIGHFFGGRDHSTVFHACRVTAKRRANDPKLHNAMRRLTLELVR